MSKRNRRQFLEDSMWSAAVAVTGSSEVRADDQSTLPCERLGVAIIGARGRGGSHIGAFAGRRDTEILYICDVDREVGERRVREAGKRQRGRRPIYVEDLRWVLADPRVDIVSIATPNHWHALASIWAMQAGKDVFVEKPVSHNVLEGRLMVEAARKYRRVVQSGLQARSNPGIQSAIEFIHQGGIGEVRDARALCYKRRPSIGMTGSYSPPMTLNYDLWQGPAPSMPLSRSRFHHDWHWQWNYGNGELGNQGVHQMDLARWGLQLTQLSGSFISCGGRWGGNDAGETPNTHVMLHENEGKSIAFEIRGLTSSSYRHGKIGVMFQGTDGYVVLPSYQGGAAFDATGNKIREFRGKGDHFANFVEAVKSRRLQTLNADIEEGHISSALCHLGNISYRLGEYFDKDEALTRVTELDTRLATPLHLSMNHSTSLGIEVGGARIGRKLLVDGRTETILNDPAANSLLTREYRAPFGSPSVGSTLDMTQPEGFRIIYEEGPCLVIEKPGGVLTQAPPNIDSMEVRVKRFIRERDQKPGKVYLGVVHRLDRPVSGVMVLGLNQRATKRLSEQFEGRTVTKKYWAVLEGVPEEEEGTWVDHLRKIPGVAKSEVVSSDHDEGRKAVLHYKVLDAQDGLSLVEIQLETGRTHQIRVQASSRGMPVCGDEQYGSQRTFGEQFEDIRDRSIALHARSLRFRHPTSKEKVEVTAPLPASWADVPFELK